MTDVNSLARLLASIHARETAGERIKWERLTPKERSLWRLMARAAIEHINKNSR